MESNSKIKSDIMKQILFSLLLFCVLPTLVFAQRTVKGIVTDNNGDALIGVTIVVDGTKNGVSTNLEGKYAIQVSEKDVLKFSYVGMLPVTVKVGTRDVINVTLKDDLNQLNELVVVGYGTQKKVNLTGSVQSVDGRDLIKRNTSTASVALQGLVPGLTAVQSSGQPGADNASISIRGTGSLNSSTSPLILIDGVEGDMNRIDLNSVESISILKDAASASIYGSRASNGVILITTKRGAAGKVKVSYNTYLGFNTPTNLPEPVSGLEYMEAINQACVNADQAPIYSADVIDVYKNGAVDNFNYYDTDWKNEVLKKSAFLQNHSLSISAGNDIVKFFANAGYYAQDGIIENNNFSRATLRTNSDIQLRKWIKLSLDINMRQTRAKRPTMDSATGIVGKALTLTPIMSGINSDGTWGYGQNGYNPIAIAEDGGVRNDISPEVGIKGRINITPFQGMNILAGYSFRQVETESNAFVDPYDTYENGIFKMSYPAAGSTKTEERSKSITKQFNVQASYEKTISDHYFKLLAGMQTDELNYNYLFASRKNFNYEGYEDLANGDVSTMGNSSAHYDWAQVSYLYRVNYSYANKYLLELDGRYDGTSRFLKDSRWGFFPSFSAGWRISEEKFWLPIKSVVDNLKLRASYGILGNQSINSYYPFAASVSSNAGYGYWFDKQLVTGVAQTQLANEKITWEKSKQLNAGIDISLFNSKLGLTFDYYVRNISNMLQTFPLPLYVAMSSPWKNAGSMRNNGWELSLSWRDKINSFSYYVTGNLSDVKNKVTNLYGNEYIGSSTITKEGEPINSYYGYVSDGYFQSQEEIDNAVCVYGGNKNNIKPGYIKYRDINHDDAIDSKDRTIIGNPTPRYGYGLTLGGDCKGFDFSLFFQGVGKKDVFYSGAGARPLYSGYTLYKNQLDTWSEDNKNAKFPILLIDGTSSSNSNNIVSDFWIKSGAYLRLKSVVLGYTLPKKMLQKLSIDNIRFYVNAQNLFTISNAYKGYDPENGGSFGSFYPIMKTFTFGLNIDF